jgi:hypothetical protein
VIHILNRTGILIRRKDQEFKLTEKSKKVALCKSGREAIPAINTLAP